MYKEITVHELKELIFQSENAVHWQAYTGFARHMYGDAAHKVVTLGYSHYNDNTNDDGVALVAVYDANGTCLSHRVDPLPSLDAYDPDDGPESGYDHQIICEGSGLGWNEQRVIQQDRHTRALDKGWYTPGTPFTFEISEAFYEARNARVAPIDDGSGGLHTFYVGHPPSVPRLYISLDTNAPSDADTTEPMTSARQATRQALLLEGDDA